MTNATIKDIEAFVQAHNRILIMQADNPDGDSLASSLALEHILGDLGKDPILYCGVDMPTYLRYLPGWDRVTRDIPAQFDASIIVDTSSIGLFENLAKQQKQGWVASKPSLIIDHHDVELSIPFATLCFNTPVVATGEAIYEIATKLKWPINSEAKKMVAVTILSDSLGLMSEATSSRSIQIISELVASGVNLAELDSLRKELMRKSQKLLKYKGELLQRVSYDHSGRIAYVVIPWKEIEEYSPYYNPSMLVLDDMRLVDNVDIAIAFKTYNDGKITGKIRCNFGKGIAGNLAESFGGGGHSYASGFKITNNTGIDEVCKQVFAKANELLDNLPTTQD